MAAKGNTKQEQTAEEAAAPPKKSRKRLFIVLSLLIVLGGGGGGAGWWFLLEKPRRDAEHAKAEQDEAAGAESGALPARTAGKDAAPRVFVRLDPFTTNLADEDDERVAQIVVNVELQDAKAQEELARVLPVVRNRILYLLSSQQSAALRTIAGKNQLAQDIALRTGLAMGWESPEPVDELRDPVKVAATGADAGAVQPAAMPAAAPATAPAAAPAAAATAARPSRSRSRAAPNPVVAVHFEQIIVQ